MKKCRILVSLALVCVICLSLCACGISKDKAVGTWSGAYVYDGNNFAVAFSLSADGECSKVTMRTAS